MSTTNSPAPYAAKISFSMSSRASCTRNWLLPFREQEEVQASSARLRLRPPFVSWAALLPRPRPLPLPAGWPVLSPILSVVWVARARRSWRRAPRGERRRRIVFLLVPGIASLCFLRGMTPAASFIGGVVWLPLSRVSSASVFGSAHGHGPSGVETCGPRGGTAFIDDLGNGCCCCCCCCCGCCCVGSGFFAGALGAGKPTCATNAK